MKKAERFRSALSVLFFCVNRNLSKILTLAGALKFDGAVHKCKECVILADAYILTRMEFGSSLANENVACENELTICTLGAQSFCCTLTTVVR